MTETLMLLDPDGHLQPLVEGMQARLGRVRVVRAEGYHEGLRLVHDTQPAVALLDLESPVGLGYHLLSRIKRTRHRTRIVAVVAANRVTQAMGELRQAGEDVLAKPVCPLALEMALRRIFEKIRLERRLDRLQRQLADEPADHLIERIETERFIAVKQMVDKLSTFIGRISHDVEGGLRYFGEMPYFVAIHNKHCRVIATNATYKRHFGNKIGAGSWEIYSADHALRETCPVGRSLRHTRALKVPATVRYRSGTTVPVIVHTAPIYNNDGQAELILEVFAGTREVKRLKTELQATRQKYQQLFDEVPCFVAVLDRAMRLTTVNRRFKEEFGDAIGRHFYDTFSQRIDTHTNCPIQATIVDGRAHQGDMVLVHANGRSYKTMIWTAPIFTTAGKLLQILVIIVDVTALRDLQDHLTSLGLMIGSMSHGIKGVLTGLDAGLYMIDSGFYKNRPGRIEEGLEVSRLMVARIRKVVSDILYYAKERELKRERVSARNFAREVAMDAGPKIRGSNIAFVHDFQACSGELDIDPGVVRSAFVNILENAVEACVADTREHAHRIIFTARPDGDTICFEISDNGVGLSSEDREQMFTLFYSSKGSKGTGLGLFITDKVIRQHGGRIEVSSQPGEGTCFAIRLPKAPIG